MPHWNDLGHYTIELGDVIQSRIMGWPVLMPGAENYGTRLTDETIEPWFNHIREGYKAYLASPAGAEDIAKKEEWIAEGVAKKK